MHLYFIDLDVSYQITSTYDQPVKHLFAVSWNDINMVWIVENRIFFWRSDNLMKLFIDKEKGKQGIGFGLFILGLIFSFGIRSLLKRIFKKRFFM